MDQQNRKPLTEDIREEQTDNVKDTAEQAQPVPVYAERAETVLPEADGDELRALAVKTAAKSLTASPARCIDLAGKFEQARQWCESNIGAGHLLAWMAAVCSSGQ